MSHHTPQRVDLHLIVPLDVPWILSGATFGLTLQIDVDGWAGSIRMPSLNERRTGGRPPEGFERSRDIEEIAGWMQISVDRPDDMQFLLKQLALVVPIETNSPLDPAAHEDSTLVGFDALKSSVTAWIGRFAYWTHLVLGQSLDRTRPIPSTLCPAGSRVYSWGVLDGRQSVVSTNPAPLTIVVTPPEPSPLAEWVLDIATFGQMASLASDPDATAPLALELLASARLAAQRGELRLAIAEMGTAIESILRQRMGIDPTKRVMLKPLVLLAQTNGLDVPGDILEALVYPRNAAVHQGTVPALHHVLRSLEITQQQLAVLDNRFTKPANLVSGFRPQRLDLLMLQ